MSNNSSLLSFSSSSSASTKLNEHIGSKLKLILTSDKIDEKGNFSENILEQVKYMFYDPTPENCGMMEILRIPISAEYYFELDEQYGHAEFDAANLKKEEGCTECGKIDNFHTFRYSPEYRAYDDHNNSNNNLTQLESTNSRLKSKWLSFVSAESYTDRYFRNKVKLCLKCSKNDCLYKIIENVTNLPQPLINLIFIDYYCHERFTKMVPVLLLNHHRFSAITYDTNDKLEEYLNDLFNIVESGAAGAGGVNRNPINFYILNKWDDDLIVYLRYARGVTGKEYHSTVEILYEHFKCIIENNCDHLIRINTYTKHQKIIMANNPDKDNNENECNCDPDLDIDLDRIANSGDNDDNNDNDDDDEDAIFILGKLNSTIQLFDRIHGIRSNVVQNKLRTEFVVELMKKFRQSRPEQNLIALELVYQNLLNHCEIRDFGTIITLSFIPFSFSSLKT